jgi:hypothetical protein
VIRYFAVALPGLLCGGGMLFMRAMMARRSHGSSSPRRGAGGVVDADVGELRDEVARLRRELNGRQSSVADPEVAVAASDNTG